MGAVAVVADTVVVTVAVRRHRLRCPDCAFATRVRYDTRPMVSTGRPLDLGVWRRELRAGLRRLRCPVHGVRTEAVPVARSGSRHTRDVEDLVGYLAPALDRTALGRLLRRDWDTVGRICTRVMTDRLAPTRLAGLFAIGVDEVSWRRRHPYLTRVSDHRRGRILWGPPGMDAATLDSVFDALGTDRAAPLTAVSMDRSPAFEKSARAPGPATNAGICYDPCPVVALATTALDTVRPQVWQEMRGVDADVAHRFKGARWYLLKNPENLNDDPAVPRRRLRRRGGAPLGVPRASRRPCAPAWPATSTLTQSPTSSTASAPRRSAAACGRSSPWRRRSGRDRPASSLRSASASPMPSTKASTAGSDSSSTGPTASPPPRPPSPW